MTNTYKGAAIIALCVVIAGGLAYGPFNSPSIAGGIVTAGIVILAAWFLTSYTLRNIGKK